MSKIDEDTCECGNKKEFSDSFGYCCSICVAKENIKEYEQKMIINILKEFKEGRHGVPIFWIDKHFYIEHWDTDDKFYLNCLSEEDEEDEELNEFTVMPPKVVEAWVFSKRGKGNGR